MNDILQALNFSSTYQNVNNLYQNFELLKLPDIHRLELAKFMYKLEHNKLPKLFNNNFVKTTNHHKYGTLDKLPAPIAFFLVLAKKIAQSQLSFRGSKIWSTINLQIKNKQWDSFTKQYIQSLLNSY